MKKLIQFLKKYEFPIHLFVGWTIICVQASTRFHTATTKLKLKLLRCPVGKGFIIDGKLWIWAQKKECICIGDNVRINSRFGSNLVGITNPAVFQCLENGTITIGDNCGLSAVVLSTRSSITIGNRVKIGGNVRVFDHNYHSLSYENRRDPVLDQKGCRTAPVQIGNDVFIGTNAMVLKGVTVGDRAVIGAESVVVSNVPEGEVWAGNPARRVR